MSRTLYTLNNHEQYKKNNWTEVDTMKWKKVPHWINVFLNAANAANKYYLSIGTDEKVLSRFHKQLLKECRDDIVKVNIIIDDARKYITSCQSNGLAITYHENRDKRYKSIVSRVYQVSQNGFTNYRCIYDNSRGRAATYRYNFEIFREDVKDSIFFTKIDSSIEEKINQEKYDFDYQDCLGTLERTRERMRKDLDRRMSKEVIIKKAQETLYNLAIGKSTSSLGAFSFDRNSHMYFIETGTGKLVDLNTEHFPHPRKHYEFKSLFALKSEHKIVLDDLSNEINTMLVDLHDASKDWYETMSDISDALRKKNEDSI
tara:strand:- start:1458 stop:2405 length:948 start_codon:yes stop_codon:yes gene_type:complete